MTIGDWICVVLLITTFVWAAGMWLNLGIKIGMQLQQSIERAKIKNSGINQ